MSKFYEDVRLGQIWVDTLTREMVVVKWEHKTLPKIFKTWNPILSGKNKGRQYQSEFSINNLSRLVSEPEEWV